MNVDVGELLALSTWIYLLIVAMAAGDAVVPVLPSESIVILAGVLAAGGDLDPFLVVGSAAVGALAGDTTSFLLGRSARSHTRRLPRGRTGRVLAWGRRMLHQQGTQVLVVARFIPGGRTATTFASGYLDLPGRSFLLAVATGGLLWATYSTAVGYIGGTVFHDNVLLGVILGIAIGLAVGAAIHRVRVFRAHRRGTATPAEAPEPSERSPAP